MKPQSTYAAIAICTLALMAAGPAIAQQAQDFMHMSEHLRVQTRLFSRLVTAFAFLMGVFLTFQGITKFRKNVDNPNDPSSSSAVAFIFIFAGAVMVALPALIATGAITFFGSTEGTTNAFGGGNVIPFR